MTPTSVFSTKSTFYDASSTVQDNSSEKFTQITFSTTNNNEISAVTSKGKSGTGTNNESYDLSSSSPTLFYQSSPSLFFTSNPSIPKTSNEKASLSEQLFTVQTTIIENSTLKNPSFQLKVIQKFQWHPHQHQIDVRNFINLL